MQGRKKDPRVQEIIRQCNELGITYTSYLRRLQTGWTKEEALSTARVGAVYRTKDGTPIFTYLKSIGKSYGTFNNLIHLGFSVEEALEHTLKCENRTRNKYFRDGMTLRQYCIKNGLDYAKEYYWEVKKNGKVAR